MRRTPTRRLRLTELEGRLTPVALTPGNLLQAFTDTDPATQVSLIGGAEVAVPGGADVQSRTFNFGVGGLDQINGGVAIANGVVYFAAYTPNGPFGDDFTVLFRYTPATDQLVPVRQYNRESGGLAFLPDGSLVSAWFDGTYLGKNPNGPDAGKVGLSRIDPATGAETVLFSEAVTIGANQAYATIPRPTAVAAVGGKYFFTTSVAGQPGSSGNSAADDKSTLRVFDPAAPGAAPTLSTFNREAYALAATPDGKLVEQWYDGVYTINSPFSAASATIGVSRIDPATGAETALATENVPNLPQQGQFPSTPPPTQPGGVAVLPGGKVTFAVTQPSLQFTDPALGTVVNFRNTTSIRLVDPAAPGVVTTFATSARFTTALAQVPAPPNTQTDTFTTAVNTPFNAPAPGVLGNDSSPNTTAPLVATLVTPPPAAQGTVVLNADGSFAFTPAAGFVGNATFTYTASDGLAVSAPTAVTVIVLNQPPTAAADSYTTPAGKPLTVAAAGVLANDTDPDGPNPLTAQLVAAPPAAQGSVTLNANGSFTFTPAAGFAGTTSFTYAAFDGNATSLPATVTISVTNQAPVAAADAFTTPAGKPLTVAAPGVLANDSDPDATGPFNAVLVSAPPAAQGAVALNANGSFTFSPAAGFAGAASFTYSVSDGIAASAPATVTITVTNQAPVAAADAFSTPAGQALTVAAPGLLANDSDPDNTGPLTAALVAAPPAAQGAVVVNANGSFTFTPAAGFTGTTSFTYLVSDGIANSAPATVTITVTPLNQPPVSRADTYTTPAGRPLTVPAGTGVLANDTDPDGPNALTAQLVAGPPAAQGAVTLNADGSFTFTPAAGFAGTTSFTYAAFDGIARGAAATVTITVTNQLPVAQPDTFSVATGQALTVAAPGLLANDSDPDNTGPLTAALVAAPPAAQGAVVVNANGSFTFTPAAGFTGTTSFTYTASDGVAASQPATVTVTVTSAATRTRLVAVGAGAGGGPRVRVFDAAGAIRFDFYAFEETFTGGVRVAVGDVTGDGTDDIIVGAGTGGGPRVRVFDGATGAVVRDFFAYEDSFRGGVHLAAVDLNDDGVTDIVTGPGSTGGPRVRAFDGRTLQPLLDFFAFPADHIGGVRVAADVRFPPAFQRIAAPEIYAAEGPSGDGEVRSFAMPVTPGLVAVQEGSSRPFGVYHGGLFLASRGGTQGSVLYAAKDSVPDYAGSVFEAVAPGLSAADVTSPPVVSGLSGGGTVVPYPADFLGGVRVAAGNGTDFDFVTAPGPDGGSLVRFYKGGAVVREFAAFEDAFRGGVFVAASV